MPMNPDIDNGMRFENPILPYDLNEYFQTHPIETVQLSNTLAISSVKPQQWITNEDLVNRVIQHGVGGENLKIADAIIKSTGFRGRDEAEWIVNNQPDIQTVTDRSAVIAAFLLREVMNAKGWDHPDIIVTTSAFLPPEVGEMTLDYAGVRRDRVELVLANRTACSGFAGAWGEMLYRFGGLNKNVVILALEPLSALGRDEDYTPQRIMLRALFGDGHSAMAFNTNDMRLKAISSLVVHDNNVIKMNTGYDFANWPHDPNSIPPYIKFLNGGEKIYKYHPDYGTAIDITGSENHTGEMDGVLTGIFFGEHTVIPVEDVVKQSGNPNLLTDLGYNLVSHVPSEGVWSRILKKYWLKKLIPDRHALPFPMNEYIGSNTSSETLVQVLFSNIKNNRIVRDKYILVVAPGIGSKIDAVLIEQVFH